MLTRYIPSALEDKPLFGFFVCSKCPREWFSSRAFKIYGQNCKGCEGRSRPKAMWLNYPKHHAQPSGMIDRKKQHDSARCEACELGVCSPYDDSSDDDDDYDEES